VSSRQYSRAALHEIAHAVVSYCKEQYTKANAENNDAFVFFSPRVCMSMTWFAFFLYRCSRLERVGMSEANVSQYLKFARGFRSHGKHRPKPHRLQAVLEFLEKVEEVCVTPYAATGGFFAQGYAAFRVLQGYFKKYGSECIQSLIVDGSFDIMDNFLKTLVLFNTRVQGRVRGEPNPNEINRIHQAAYSLFAAYVEHIGTEFFIESWTEYLFDPEHLKNIDPPLYNDFQRFHPAFTEGHIPWRFPDIMAAMANVKWVFETECKGREITLLEKD
jgi:hypothetical protein